MNIDPQKLLSNIIHELGAPLRAGSGFSRLTLADAKSELSEQAQRWLQLTEDQSILGMKKLEALGLYNTLLGYESSNIAAVKFDSLCSNIIATVDQGQPSTLIGATAGYFMLDTYLMTMALSEIFENSFNHAGENSRDVKICLASEKISSGLRIKISDNGPGLQGTPPETCLEAFKSRNKNSTGMGLALAQLALKKQDIDLSLVEIDSGLQHNLDIPASLLVEGDDNWAD
jgi:K+-sensing histidine kinase KdpD